MGILSKLFGGQGTKAPEVTSDIKVFTGVLDRSPDINDVFVAGVQHHCTRKNVGFFTGLVYNQKDNPYDKKAMAIGCHQTSKIVGYVPSAILDSYRKWCDKSNCPCCGYIFFDGESLKGRIRAYLPSHDQAEILRDMQEYANLVCEHFGWQAPHLEA